MNLGPPRSATTNPGAPSPGISMRAPAQSLIRFTGPMDIAMLAAWVFSTALPLGWAAPLRYLAAAYFVASLVLFARQTLPGALRGWPTLILPFMCILSALWAPAPAEAIRKGLMFLMGSGVAIYAATRVSGRNILLVFMGCETIAALMCLQHPGIVNGAWTGIFGQKNFLAVNMFILYISAFAIVLDRETLRWFRFWALSVAPLAFALIVLAKSATTTVLLIGATGAMVGHTFLWQPAARVPHLRMLLVLFTAALLLAAGLILIGFMNVDLKTSVLDALGKDSTLTGRTYLWETAERTMAEHPMLGVGADGFWRSEYGLANAITRYFDFETYVHFSFHNSYLENGVAFGYPGYWATVFIAAWAILIPGINWLRNQTTINAAFLILAMMVILRTTTEIDLALEFTATSSLLMIGATRRERRRHEAVASLAIAKPRSVAQRT